MTNDEPTALYRLYDANDVLLYIGISNDPDFRWKAHQHGVNRDGWPSQATRRTVEWRNTRAEALSAEVDAIRAEQPRCNGTHNYDDAPFTLEEWPTVQARHKVPAIAELMRTEILSGRWKTGQRIPLLRTLGDAAGVSIRTVSKACVVLQQEGLLDLQPGRGVFVLPHAEREDVTA